jgi:hypothetical protein
MSILFDDVDFIRRCRLYLTMLILFDDFDFYSDAILISVISTDECGHNNFTFKTNQMGITDTFLLVGNYFFLKDIFNHSVNLKK